MSAHITPLLTALVILCGACTSTPARPLEYKPLHELPASYEALWRAWLEDAPNWPEQRAACLADAGQRQFLIENVSAVFMGAYARGELATHASGGLGLFERARAELVILGEHSVGTLLELHLIGDGATAHLTAGVLVEIGRACISPCVEALGRPQAQARRRAAHVLGLLPHALEAEADVRSALARVLASDEDWLTRKSAAIAVAQRATRDTTTYPARSALTRALRDPDSAVSASAAEGLAALGDLRALPALIGFLEHAQAEADFVAYGAGQTALKALTKTRDKRSVSEWKRWWTQWQLESKN